MRITVNGKRLPKSRSVWVCHFAETAKDFIRTCNILRKQGLIERISTDNCVEYYEKEDGIITRVSVFMDSWGDK